MAVLRPYRVRIGQVHPRPDHLHSRTTLPDRCRYRAKRLADLYHARWKIEELYKTAKQCLQLEPFRGCSGPLVKREPYGHFTP